MQKKSDNSPDSHTRILTTMGVPPRMQDRWSKYEYNPITRKFTIDEPVETHDHEAAERWSNNLDYKRVVAPLIIKPIIHPFNIKPILIAEIDKKNLQRWDSVRDSVWDSVWDSVRDSVRDSVGDSVWDSVWASVWDSVGDSVWDSVGDSVWDSVRDSVRDSVGAYISSFFDIRYKYDISPAIQLWERGFVPAYDGKIWRLYGAPDARVVYEWNPHA
jgi:hypothetical protein